MVDYDAFDDVPADVAPTDSPPEFAPPDFVRSSPSPRLRAPTSSASAAPKGARGPGATLTLTASGGLPRGTRVFHRRFGNGIVEGTEGNDKVVARFKGFGPKKVLLEYLTLKE